MAWNGLFSWIAGNPIRAQQLTDYVNANLDYLLKPNQIRRQEANGSHNTTSTSFVSVTSNWQASITTNGGHILMMVSGHLAVTGSGANTAEIRIDIDGSTQITAVRTKVSTPFGFAYLLDGLSAGSHTFTLQWKTTGGTATIDKTLLPLTWAIVEI